MSNKKDNKKSLKHSNKEKLQENDILKKEKSNENFFLEFMRKARSKEIEKNISEIEIKNSKNNTTKKLTVFFFDGINSLNEWVDSLLSSDKKVLWLSLFLALGMHLMINGGIKISQSQSYDILENIPVQVIGETDLYEIINVPETVAINIFGGYIDVQSTKFKNNVYAYIDVSNLGEGTHLNVPIQAANIFSRLGHDVRPSTVEITIAKKVVQEFDLKYVFINQDPNSVYTLNEPEFELKTVKVRAAQQTIDKVDKVVALIDADITESKINQTAKIVAYDTDGIELDIEIIPKEVKYNLEISRFSKVVPIEVDLIGNIDSNHGISNISFQPMTIEIYGAEADISHIESFKLSYDVTNLSETKAFTIQIKELPNGVTSASLLEINGTIEIEEIISKEISGIPIIILNNHNNYAVTFVGNNNLASIRIIGIESKVNKFTKNDAQAYIDFSLVDIGTNDMKVQIVVSDNSLVWEWISNEAISVIVKNE